MSFFEHFFSDVTFGKSETMVCCPFPHKTVSGLDFKESNPSAGVNLGKGVFNCLSCGKAFSEVGFIKSILGGTYESASALKHLFSKDDNDIHTWKTHTTLPKDIEEKIISLGISKDVIHDLNISSEDGKSISFPVFMYNKLIDVRNYRPGQTPKLVARPNSLSGIIVPFDLWHDTAPDRWTWLCAGEKDMSVARTQGLNAIMLTGGENALPLFKQPFAGRRIAILYDNDKAGLNGAKALAAFLKPIAAEVRVVTKFHEVCVNQGEDLTDYFTKYGKTRKDLIKCLEETPAFSDEEAAEQIERITPTISLLEASQPRYVNKQVRSNIQVVATLEGSFVAPTFIEGRKVKVTADKEHTMELNDTRTWELNERNLADILHLIDNKFTEARIDENILDLLRIPKKESGIAISKPAKTTVFKCGVTDLFESNQKNTSLMEYSAYSIGHKLESGKKYKATYKLVPHPYNGQQLIMLITDVEEAADTVSSFKVDGNTIPLLQEFQKVEGSVPERMRTIVEKAKGIINWDAHSQLVEIIDLTFHTVLAFDFGRFKSVRGYLDTLVVSESRVGKSTVTEAFRSTYNLGTFASLAGSSATIGGLIGGSNKVNGSFQIRAGLIPQNHQGMVIFEELAKCKSDVIQELTDIRSSNQVRINRVSGTLSLPATVRMLTLTNVRAQNGVNRPITSYPNGIEILTQLIGTAEDMARYDIMLILGFSGSKEIDPLWEPLEPFSDEAYKTRIRWIWSRDESQVIIDADLARYIIEQCNILNKDYDCHIKIFGTEAWKKVSRLAIAVAGYLVSTDDSYEKIIVKQEHVDYAINILIKVYNNPTFKLKEYVDSETRYRLIDQAGVDTLQQLYITHTTLLDLLESSAVSSRNELMAATGLANDAFNTTINSLVTGLFIRFQGANITPTERFRIGMSKINRNVRHKKVGEVHEVQLGNT